MTGFYEILSPAEAEIEVKKSRFLCHLAPVRTEDEAREVIDECRSTHPKARHHCSAFVLTNSLTADAAGVAIKAHQGTETTSRGMADITQGQASTHVIMRSNDDGEPSGTAGKPIMDVLTGHDLRNIIAVVTRYFGGTKLGAGGLTRAYGNATSAGIEAATVTRRALRVPMSITVDYSAAEATLRYAEHHGWPVIGSSWGATVRHVLGVPPEEVEVCMEALAAISAGTAEIDIGAARFL